MNDRPGATEALLEEASAAVGLEERPLPARTGFGGARRVRVASGQGFWGDWQDEC